MLGGWIRTFWAIPAAIIAALSIVGPAQAQSGLAGAATPVCIAPVHPGDTPTAMLRATDRFDCDTPQPRFGSGNYWVRATRLPGDPGTRAASVRIASLWHARATLYAAYADGTLVAMPMDGRDATRHIQLGAIIEQPLPNRGVRIDRLLWKVEGAANLRGVVIGARIATPDQSASANLLLGALYAAFGGLCIALIVYNLALWTALRHGFQLAYCAMVASLLVYAISSSGALGWLFPGMENNDRIRVNYVALAVSAAAALAFARCFFEERVFRGHLSIATNVAMAIPVIAAVGFAVAAPRHIALLDHVCAGTFVVVVATVVPILWNAWRRRSNYLWLFAVAWATPVALAGLRIAGNFNLLDWSFLLDNSTIISMALEAMISSLAIAYRINLLSRERDVALEREIAARLLADIDPLTGLMNRRAFLRNAIGRRDDQVLLLIDIDHFKRVNDTLGHDGGDEVLRLIARALRTASPPGALVARIGGEEFAIVAPAITPPVAATLLHAIRTERMPFDLSVTASIGGCRGPIGSEIAWKALYRCADRALFDAKDAGRDRARTAQPLAQAA